MTTPDYQILETYVASKNSELICEDMIGILPHYIVVLDGVTSKTNILYQGLSGGRFAAEIILATMSEIEPNIDARTAIDILTKALSKAIIKESSCFPLHPPGTQLAIFSVGRRELWRVGDIQARIGDTILTTWSPPTDEIVLNFRAALLSAFLEEGTPVEELIKNDPAREVVLPLLFRQDAFANMNKDHYLSYGIINGTHVPDKYILVDTVPVGSEVVLATDGYLSCGGTLEENETMLKRVTEIDPLMIGEHKKARPVSPNGSFDDRAWVRFITH